MAFWVTLLLRSAARSWIISGSVLDQQRQWPCPQDNEDSLLVRFYLKGRVVTNSSEQVLNCFWAFQEFNFPSVVPMLYKLIESTSTATLINFVIHTYAVNICNMHFDGFSYFPRRKLSLCLGICHFPVLILIASISKMLFTIFLFGGTLTLCWLIIEGEGGCSVSS